MVIEAYIVVTAIGSLAVAVLGKRVNTRPVPAPKPVAMPLAKAA